MQEAPGDVSPGASCKHFSRSALQLVSFSLSLVAESAIHSGPILLQIILVFVHAAPVGKETGDGAGCGQKLGYAYVLVRGVRHSCVARAVHYAGHISEADEEPHVRAVGDAFYGRLLPSYKLVGLLQGLADRGVNFDFGGSELAAEPLQLWGMFP